VALGEHPPETDLHLPLPGDEQWDPHTIHTHYFGLSIPEAAIGAFIYIRYQPAFPLIQGGVAIFRGLDNVSPLGMAHLDYEMTMPWPTIDGNTITTDNGLRVDFLEPGRKVRVTYTSADGQTTIDVTQTAVSPLLTRGHIMPGEDAHHGGEGPGGSEQFMHCVGDLTLNGEHFPVDCHSSRDRSWRQVRTERQDAVKVPPVGWSPMYFGEDLIFNQISFQHPDTDPVWADTYQLPPGGRTHHFAWVVDDGETHDIVRVRRNVLEYHPKLYAATKQEIEAEDDRGRVYRFTGEAIAMAAVPAWPNVALRDSVFRWEDEAGRVTHQTYQEVWFDKFEKLMQERSRTALGA
jgi:hypothetical protein